METVSDEKLEKMRHGQYRPGPNEWIAMSEECISHRVRLAQAAQVVDAEGLRRLGESLSGFIPQDMIDAFDAHLAALESGVRACPACGGDKRGIRSTDPDLDYWRECPDCHGHGMVILLSAPTPEAKGGG